MLKVEVIKFEAQDVITASGVVLGPGNVQIDACTNENGHSMSFQQGADGNWRSECSHCGFTGTIAGGSTVTPK